MKPAPDGLRPPPRHAPPRVDSTEDLRVLQRLMTHALVRPLGPGDRTPRRWADGRTAEEVTAEYLKPNDRLTALERLEIYQRSYWYRLIGAATDDCPALCAFLGERRFDRLIRAYLARYPSRSFTLRNLCSRLPQFIREEPRLTAPRTAAAGAIARTEWAQTVAFDGERRPALALAAIRRTPPERLRVDLQPYLTLLALEYPTDQFIVAVKQRIALRAEASNAVDFRGRRRAAGRRPPLRRARVWLAVHRHDNRVYFKRLEAAQYRILAALRDGATLERALRAAGRSLRPESVQEWFGAWMRQQWLCRRKS